MKNLILTLLLVILSSTMLTANEQDTLWLRTTTSGVKDLDFTPDDKYVIAWTNSIEFWNVETATMDFIVPNIKVGGMTPDEKYLVFIQDGVPKMLDIETKEIIGGFEVPKFSPNHVKVGNDNSIFMCSNEKDSLFIWDAENKKIEKVFGIETDFIENGEEFAREITDYGFAGNNDDFLFVSIKEENKLPFNHPDKMVRRASLFYNRGDLTKFDLIDRIGDYRTMNLNKDIIAIDNYDGSIQLYDIRFKNFIDSLRFHNKSVSAGDIEFTEDDKILGVTQGNSCCRFLKLYDFDSKEKILQYNIGSWGQMRISNNEKYLITSIANILSLYPNQWDLTNIRIQEKEKFLVFPNPSSNSVMISYSFDIPTNYKIQVFDTEGKVLSVLDEGYVSGLTYSKEFNINYLSNGTYFIKLEYGVHSISKQFIKE